MTSRLAALGLCALITYFAYHAFAGEAGLGAWADLQTRLADRETELAALEREIALLEADIQRLSPGSVDPDYVEQLARAKLAYVYPGELILMEN